jgi:hypothetical protein
VTLARMRHAALDGSDELDHRDPDELGAPILAQ